MKKQDRTYMLLIIIMGCGVAILLLAINILTIQDLNNKIAFKQTQLKLCLESFGRNDLACGLIWR
jgi:hypothetical protein